MGLDLSDKVEVYFEESPGMSLVERAVSTSVNLFHAKFQGAVPLPKKIAPSWIVVLCSDSIEIGGFNLEIFICRPAVAGREGVSNEIEYFLATLEPKSVVDSTSLINYLGRENSQLETRRGFLGQHSS